MILEIEDKHDLAVFILEARKLDLLTDVDIRGISNDKFPARIRINTKDLSKLAENHPAIKKLLKLFGKQFKATVSSYIKAMT